MCVGHIDGSPIKFYAIWILFDNPSTVVKYMTLVFQIARYMVKGLPYLLLSYT